MIKAAHEIAQRLFEAKVRLTHADDNGALLMMPQHLQAFVAATWLRSVNHDVEIAVSGVQVRTLGAEQAWIAAVFEDVQRSDFATEVDTALWLIQQQDIRDRRGEAAA